MLKNDERYLRQSWLSDPLVVTFYAALNIVKSWLSISEQTFLYFLWTLCEAIQASIYDQDSDTYKLLDVINPIIFEAWLGTGRRGDDSQF